MKRIVIITNIPSPYRIPLFNQLHKDFRENGFLLHIVFLAKTYARRKWNVNEKEFCFEFTYLNDWIFLNGEGFSSLALTLYSTLKSLKPDVLIVGGFSFASIWALAYCKLNDANYIIWSGETKIEYQNRHKFQYFRNVIRRPLIHYSSAFVVYGKMAKEYLISQEGVNPKSIFVGINTIDTSFLKEKTELLRTRALELQSKKPKKEKNILFIGYLEKRKGVQFILTAAHYIKQKYPKFNFGIHIVGSGGEEMNLKKLTVELELSNVNFWGFKQKEEIPEYFAMSDLLIFPSTHELYGLVPIEAMAAGLPVFCSENAGCAPDVIINKKTGVLFQPENFIQLGNLIYHYLNDDALLKDLASNAQRHVCENLTIKRSTQGFISATQYVLLD